MLVMISRNGLCSCCSDSLDNAIYLGQEEAPKVPLARRKTLHFFAQLLIWAVLNCQDITPPPSCFELVASRRCSTLVFKSNVALHVIGWKGVARLEA